MEFTSIRSPRKTQILAADAVAVLTALVLTPELLEGKETVWFVGCSQLVGQGHIPRESVSLLAGAAHGFRAVLVYL